MINCEGNLKEISAFLKEILGRKKKNQNQKKKFRRRKVEALFSIYLSETVDFANGSPIWSMH